MGGAQTIAYVAGDGVALATSIERVSDDLTVRPLDSPGAITTSEISDLDYVLLEHTPSSLDAFENLDKLRDWGEEFPIVLLTREHDADVAARAVNAGFDGYVHWQDGARETASAVLDVLNSVEEKRSQTDRKRRLERYETIVEVSGDPVYTLDEDGIVTFANEALATMTGHDLDEIIGHHVSEMMKDEHVARGTALIKEILDAEDLSWGTFEMDVETVGGETLTCENHVALLPYEESFRGTVGILRDVTDRKRREAVLQEERDRLNAVFETIPEPIVHVRFEGEEPIVEDVNTSFVETFGMAVEDLNEQSINDVIVPESVLDEAKAIDASADTTDFVERTVQRKTVDGVRDFVLRATRFDVSDGDRESIVAYLDITEQKERERDLERQNERLDQFASVVSHDLRNPLNVASGRVELAREDCDSPHLSDVATALNRMEGLIQNLLTLAKYGDPVTDEVALSLESIARASWESVDTGAGATLEVAADWAFVGNHARVQSLFENLFRNAIDHCGDAVSVRVTPIDSGFAIEDDGPGLPDDDIDVFEGGVSTDPDGTGFGLHIVAEIVEAHGWTISTASGINGGARFEITGVETPS
ncbi:Signal transduction histidine kinase [Halanaeroarchaeum sp. HSR-CO]|uniref:sensor histidine kinase n=1 Tax=Halanaeroarchaeum sp. HSR-CO TaxID=2866382 RepID=UPI00217DF792|nr:PAS domain-containing sensor histidine kinase [Halanaeroarchaeum sp. HSR-CO]UWG47723.1 Signal transduction histidine kinase [Halanaeroarchaeum sp. HSR-CO]